MGVRDDCSSLKGMTIGTGALAITRICELGNGHWTGRERNVSVSLPGDFGGLNESNLWIFGYWGWNWWFETRKIIKVIPGAITFRQPEAPLKPGARYFLFNTAKGLDRDGVFYFHAPTDSVYFVPDGDASGELTVAIADFPPANKRRRQHQDLEMSLLRKPSVTP